MQITFNTEDGLEDLQNIHEIVVNAIKKKGGQIIGEGTPQNQAQSSLTEQKVQVQTVQGTSFMQNPQPPTASRLANSSFASMLRSEQSNALGSPVHSLNKTQINAPFDNRTGEIVRINQEYKRQYEENKLNPNKSRGQNPEIDMVNIYTSDWGKKRRY